MVLSRIKTMFCVAVTSAIFSCHPEGNIPPDRGGGGTPAGSIQGLTKPIEIVTIPAGTFSMGSSEDSASGGVLVPSWPVHTVKISAFSMSTTEITQKQWREVMDTSPSYFGDCDACPVENVSRAEVLQFIAKVNAQLFANYTLPTEAEWEYAAGGGIIGRTRWSGTSDEAELGKYCWFAANSSNKTQPVGLKQPNAFGLFDMSGNVAEMCLDGYAAYSPVTQTDPLTPAFNDAFVVRGGSHASNPAEARIICRAYFSEKYRAATLGFRLVKH